MESLSQLAPTRWDIFPHAHLTVTLRDANASRAPVAPGRARGGGGGDPHLHQFVKVSETVLRGLRALGGRGVGGSQGAPIGVLKAVLALVEAVVSPKAGSCYN